MNASYTSERKDTEGHPMRYLVFLIALFLSQSVAAQSLTKSEMHELEQHFRALSGKTSGDFTSVVVTSVSPIYANVKTVRGRRQFVLIFYDPVFGFTDNSFAADIIARVPVAFLDIHIDGKLDGHTSLYTRATQKYRQSGKPTYYQEYYVYVVRSLLTFFG